MAIITPERKGLVFPPTLKAPKLPDYDAMGRERAAIIAACLRSEKERIIQKIKCSEDILHWLRNFCFVYEPRDTADPDKPFFYFDFQEVEILNLVKIIQDCVGAQTQKENVLYEKSRDMTVSWIVLMVFLWLFFYHRGTFLIGSRKEEEVDRSGDMDTPFQKIKYQLKRLDALFPWLLPEGWNFKRDTGNMIIRHPMAGWGQIVGESANPEFGRGGRNLATFFDEFAKWEYAAEAWRACSNTTKVRIAVSTPGTDSDKFARLRFQQDGEVIVRTLHWTLHPEKAQDLQLINGRPTSSWYREECRTSNPEDIAKEVDISYAVSIKGKVFDRYGFGHQMRDLKPVSNRPIIRVWDPGLHFYVLWGQVDSYERLIFLKELYREGAHLDDIAREVLDISARFFGEYDFVDCGDPYGSYRQVSQQQEPEYGVLQRDYGINVHSAFLGKIAPKERVKARIQLLTKKMGEYAQDGPALLVHPDECPILDRAFGGEYKRKTDINGTVIDTIDEKHPYEDAVDCAGMLALYKIPWGNLSVSKERIHVRKVEPKWGRPSGNAPAIGFEGRR